MTDEEKEKEYKEGLKEQSKYLVEIINKSNEHFEKQLSFISGGALALSFIVIEKVLKEFFDTKCKWILIIGWILLMLTLLLNLFSHKKAIEYHGKTYENINDHLTDQKTEYDYKGIVARNNKIGKINTVSLVLLSLGLLSLIFYTSINLLCQKKTKSQVQTGAFHNHHAPKFRDYQT